MQVSSEEDLQPVWQHRSDVDVSISTYGLVSVVERYCDIVSLPKVH